MQIPVLPQDYLMPIPEATSLQKELANSVRLTPFEGPITMIAGVDVSSEWHGSHLFATVVVFSYPDLTPVETVYADHQTKFPYIPGFLSFREIPALLKAFEKLKNTPDVIFVDGHGITHPRGLGIAAHLGVLLDKPTVGVGKSQLYGKWKEPENAGETEYITHPQTGARLGIAYKSKARSKPILISPGNRITLEEALILVQSMLQGYRLPLTTRAAHDSVNAYRREWKEKHAA